MEKPPASSEEEYSYFQIQSIWGVTKHFGGVRVTEQLANLCRIEQSSCVLEVGSGVGFTACHLAKKIGCRIIGVDLSESMVEWARQRATRKGLQDLCQFRVADAQQLPFENGSFDAMLCESVTAFVPDKQKALSEYRRVVRHGGYIGLNEGTLVKGEPPEDWMSFIRQAMGGVDFLQPDGWRALLEQAGLEEIVVQVHELDSMQQKKDELQGMDAQDWLHRTKAVSSAIWLYVKNPEFRRYANTLIPSRKVMRELFEYLGYGLYVGRV